ncbi:MAG: hypothetical protein II877_03990 [Synergistaceae bacterium]|nr:hypothetical protein [Synergistaceae bacterium]
MTKVEMRKLFMELRDMCKKPEFETVGDMLFSKGDEYSRIYQGLEKAGNLDVEYADHIGERSGYELASQPEKLTFKECCTVLTFLLRAERFSPMAFTGALQDGTVYKLLSRAVEAM